MNDVKSDPVEKNWSKVSWAILMVILAGVLIYALTGCAHGQAATGHTTTAAASGGTLGEQLVNTGSEVLKYFLYSLLGISGIGLAGKGVHDAVKGSRVAVKSTARALKGPPS